MEEQADNRIHRPHRRRKTRWEKFREAYLPYLILLAAAVLIVIFMIGAIARGSIT